MHYFNSWELQEHFKTYYKPFLFALGFWFWFILYHLYFSSLFFCWRIGMFDCLWENKILLKGTVVCLIFQQRRIFLCWLALLALLGRFGTVFLGCLLLLNLLLLLLLFFLLSCLLSMELTFFLTGSWIIFIGS